MASCPSHRARRINEYSDRFFETSHCHRDNSFAVNGGGQSRLGFQEGSRHKWEEKSAETERGERGFEADLTFLGRASKSLISKGS